MNRYLCVSLGIILSGQCNAVRSEAIYQESLGKWEISLAKANISLKDNGSYNSDIFLTGSGRYNSAEAGSLGFNVAYVHEKEYLVRIGLSNINYKNSSHDDNSELFGEIGYRFYPSSKAPLSISAHLGYSSVSSSGLNVLSSSSDGSSDHGVDGGLYISGALDYFLTERWGVGLNYRMYSGADLESAAGVHLSVAF